MDKQKNNWEIIDSNVITKFQDEINELKNQLQTSIEDIKKSNSEIMIYLETNRKLYSKMIKDNFELTNKIEKLLKENRILYLKAFEKEDQKLSSIEQRFVMP
jgi:hypothetical protein